MTRGGGGGRLLSPSALPPPRLLPPGIPAVVGSSPSDSSQRHPPRRRGPCAVDDRRSFSSSSSRPRRRTSSFDECPFRTLGIPKDSTYANAKKAFLRVAMRHHPDRVRAVTAAGGGEGGGGTTSTVDDEQGRDRSREIFVKCRLALESLVECEDTGLCLLRRDVERLSSCEGGKKNDDDVMSDAEFDSWFVRETGHQNPFQFDIDPATMREVADMHADMADSHGLDRDGGMWHLASLISGAVKSGREGAAESLLRLDAGNYDAGDVVEGGGRLNRRRKRRTNGIVSTTRSTGGRR
ncbi:hypothetical protein ACHAXA_003534 [Cyclostephanos tholiformis]|uniref:J domain-containing protein n=1 Tax=Cyclostephanos tholiformis TaxID=382380 RepID=A0ABD3R585_9STRA